MIEKENNMDEKTSKSRIKKLAVAIIKEVDKLPRSLASDVIGKQMLRSGTSIVPRKIISRYDQ
jgi:hypothetical protein